MKGCENLVIILSCDSNKLIYLTFKIFTIMKKNETNVENPVIEQIVMDEETMQAVVDDSKHLVPKNQLKKFEALSLKEQVAKIQFYTDIAKMKEDARIKNSVLNRVKEVFDKRHATVDDAREVIKFAQEFVDNFRQQQIEEIDRQIAELEQMKESLNS